MREKIARIILDGFQMPQTTEIVGMSIDVSSQIIATFKEADYVKLPSLGDTISFVTDFCADEQQVDISKLAVEAVYEYIEIKNSMIDWVYLKGDERC